MAPGFARTLETDVLPGLRRQNGFKDEITFLAADRAGAGGGRVRPPLPLVAARRRCQEEGDSAMRRQRDEERQP